MKIPMPRPLRTTGPCAALLLVGALLTASCDDGTSLDATTIPKDALVVVDTTKLQSLLPQLVLEEPPPGSPYRMMTAEEFAAALQDPREAALQQCAREYLGTTDPMEFEEAMAVMPPEVLQAYLRCLADALK